MMVKNNDIILEGRNITKKYGSVVALDDVSFKLLRGETVALLGDNGAGKSTLIKVFAGAHKQDSGQIFVEGRETSFSNTKDAIESGIETIYQHLALVDCLSIEKNIYLGKEIVKKYWFVNVLQNKKMQEGAVKSLKEIGIEIGDSGRKVEELSGGQRHAVAISKAAFWTKKILIMDEPTASLGVRETKKILKIILELKKKSLSIILITHNMEHAFLVSDRFFVMRAGKKVGEVKKEETSTNEIVEMITGALYIDKNGKK